MEQQTLNISDYLNALKRRRLSIFVTAFVVFSIGLSVAMLWPPTYTSTATILIKEQDIPSDLVRSTVTSFASQRIQSISQRVMARPNLLEIIAKYKLYENDAKRLTTEEIVANMRQDIELEMIRASVVDPRSGRPTTATIAFQLGFSGENPREVQQVANELMSLYLKENLKARSAQANETLDFLQTELNRLNSQHRSLEQRLTSFKEKHVNELPGSSELHLRSMDVTEEKLRSLNAQQRTFDELFSAMEEELARTSLYGGSEETDDRYDPYTRLRAMRAEYLRLTARYSPDHPDIIQTKRLIEGLERETGAVNISDGFQEKLGALVGELAFLKQKYSAAHPDVVKTENQIALLKEEIDRSASKEKSTGDDEQANSDKPTNPVYLQLQKRIRGAKIQRRELSTLKIQLEKKLAKHVRHVTQAPKLEMEYREIASDLVSTTKRRQEISAKKMQAQIALELEKENKGERFEIIEQPIQPSEPISPNRPAIIIVSLIFALGSGLGLALIMEMLSDTVRGNKSIIKAVGAPPLATIPYMEQGTDTRKRKRNFAMRTSAVIVAIFLIIAALHFLWTPLDVLWYKTIRKADIVINT